MSQGSYDPRQTTAGGLSGELARLEQQAQLSFDDEFRVLRDAGVSTADRLLEIGAGSGAITRRLRAALPQLAIFALDIDDALLAHAAGCGAALVAGDALHLPVGDAMVDVVLLRYVIQHIADPAAVLAEAARVLRPGGRIVIIEVDSACWGLADPTYPELSGVHAKAAAAQHAAGGDRTIGRRLTRLLRTAGYAEVVLKLFATSSDGKAMEEFEAHLGPHRLAPLVASGVVSIGELALASDRWERFRSNEDAWVMLVGFAGLGRKPAG